ncbi:MAG TPA: FtsX-like permease family protein [Nitrospirota bacterium]|nr:FtsX-like permease family protein [Nitrospirota bacterium]
MSRIEKQRNILDFTLSSFLRRKGKNSALALVYTFIVFMLASVMFFTHAVKTEASLVLKNAPEIVVQRFVAGRQALVPTSYAGKISTIRGVSAVKGRLWGYYYDPVFGGANYTLLVPEIFPYDDGAVAVGSGVSRNSQSVEGNILPFKGNDGSMATFRIAEVLSSDSELISADLVLMSEHDFRTLFGVNRQYVTDIILSVRNPKEVVTVARKIADILPDTRPIIRDEILRTYDAVFGWRGGILLVIFMGCLAAFVIFAWDRATGLSAEEKKEIGILKAIGWETSDVLMMKFWEGVVVSLFSFLAGILLAYIHVFFGSSALFEPVLKGWSVLYPHFRLTPFVSVPDVIILFFITVVPYTVITIIPSWRAATIDPDAVMRT